MSTSSGEVSGGEGVARRSRATNRELKDHFPVPAECCHHALAGEKPKQGHINAGGARAGNTLLSTPVGTPQA